MISDKGGTVSDERNFLVLKQRSLRCKNDMVMQRVDVVSAESGRH